METLNEIFGIGDELSILQMSARAIVIFLIALLLIRFTGMRAFGIKSAFDTCIIIMLGSVLSRAVTGSSPLIPTIVASIVLVVIHRILAVLSVNNQTISHLLKGTPVSLYKNGKLNQENLKKCALSKGDIMEEVRSSLHQDNLSQIQEIYMERTGNISIIEEEE